jgi:predicted NBD/HSP70 family sugar kinase
VLGLPCELDDAGLPRSCTYCWPDPDPHLIPDLARLANRSIEVANDAELAACAAAPMVPRDRTTLVLTVGFGVGGALLLPDEAAAW